MSLFRKRLVLFDLDGVILDSKQNMDCAWADVCEKFSLKIPFQDYFSNIGRPFKDILDILGVVEQQDMIEVVYNQSSLKRIDSSPFFPKVKDYLCFLLKNNIEIGIVTSKSKTRVKPVLNRLGIDFSIVKVPDDICRGKPAPDHLLMAMSLLNIDPSETIFIGDMDVDYMAAKRANIDYLHASWGYGDCVDKECILKNINDITRHLSGAII